MDGRVNILSLNFRSLDSALNCPIIMSGSKPLNLIRSSTSANLIPAFLTKSTAPDILCDMDVYNQLHAVQSTAEWLRTFFVQKDKAVNCHRVHLFKKPSLFW